MQREDVRRLTPGIEVTHWADMKLAHGRARLGELLGRMATWSDGGGIVGRSRLVTPRMVELVSVVGHTPPINEWALIFGEAVHALRAAFDAFAWDAARLDGGAPKTPGQVKFPVSQKASEWTNAIKHLESVPPEILERIRLQQPFLGPEPGKDVLSLLHRMDNDDKHRGLLTGSVVVTGAYLDGLSWRLADPSADPSVEFEVLDAVPIEGDQVAGRLHLASDVDEASFRPQTLRLALSFRIALEDNHLDVAQVAQFFPDVVHFLLGQLYGIVPFGNPPDDAGDEWMPMTPRVERP